MKFETVQNFLMTPYVWFFLMRNRKRIHRMCPLFTRAEKAYCKVSNNNYQNIRQGVVNIYVAREVTIHFVKVKFLYKETPGEVTVGTTSLRDDSNPTAR